MSLGTLNQTKPKPTLIKNLTIHVDVIDLDFFNIFILNTFTKHSRYRFVCKQQRSVSKKPYVRVLCGKKRLFRKIIAGNNVTFTPLFGYVEGVSSWAVRFLPRPGQVFRRYRQRQHMRMAFKSVRRADTFVFWCAIMCPVVAPIYA